MNAATLLNTPETRTPSNVGLPMTPAGDVVAQPHRSMQREALEKQIAGMECAKAGTVAFFDADAALASIVNLVSPGDEIIVGANAAARRRFKIDDAYIAAGRPVADLLGENTHAREDGFEAAERRAVRVALDDPILGTIKIGGMPIHFMDQPRHLGGPAPLLGEHNIEILKSYLDLGQAHIKKLENAGVLHSSHR